MAAEFAAQLATDHISVNRGEIKQPTRSENTVRFQQYFDAVEFEKWDDVNLPMIRFSADGSMAYTVVDKEVVLTYINESNQRMRETTHFAWVAIYVKKSGSWEIECVSSTNKTSVTESI